MGKFRERLISRFARKLENVFPEDANIIRYTEDAPEFGFIGAHDIEDDPFRGVE